MSTVRIRTGFTRGKFSMVDCCLGRDLSGGGEQTAELVTTPVEAAAAGDIGDGMGNSSSGTGAVTLTQIQPLSEKGDVKVVGNGVKKDGAVRLRMENEGYGAEKPITVQTMFLQTVQQVPDNLALAVKRNGIWEKITFREYYNQSQQAAKSLIKLGLEPHHGVSILGFNSPEWYISFLGAVFAGGKGTGIYATNTAEACGYVLKNSRSNVVVVENHAQLKKILQVWEELPDLKAIVQYTGEVAERKDNIYSWAEFLQFGKDVPDSALEERTLIQAPNTCCSLIYTSGTTGNPKGVMISHDNYTWVADKVGRQIKVVFGKEISISFLPLSHIAAQMLDFIVALKFGGAVYFAQPDALKGSLLETWKEVRPTTVFAVPRLWEKINERLASEGSKRSNMARKISAWARDKGRRGSQAQSNGGSKPWGWSIANILVFRKLKTLLGLDRCKLFGSGAAPIMKDTLEFFSSLNIRIDEVYGMSECTGPHTFNTDGAYKMTSVGKEMWGVKTRLHEMDHESNGEICFWGRHVFMGYLNEPEKNKEIFGDDDWLHSGDIGRHDEDGFLYITGRIKELIITAGGENVAPVPIEDNVKEALPCVSNCMLIGDKRKFLSMLITLKTDLNLDTNEPLDTLTKETLSWYQSIGSQARTAIQAGVDKANKKAVSNAARVQKWTILPKDFSLPGGELGNCKIFRQKPYISSNYLESTH
ncbi:ACBG2-like protein, partial [Mya arenaria]